MREQLKYIREELGEDGTTSDAEEFERQAAFLALRKCMKVKRRSDALRR
ncbi:MAG: hypothetical protein ACLUUO_10055 [Sellimonas intestinalis]